MCWFAGSESRERRTKSSSRIFPAFLSSRAHLGTVLAVLLFSQATQIVQGQGASRFSDAPCANIPHLDHPKAIISNGSVTALVFLPDVKNGYYRSTRFDWSGVVGCVAYKGHTFFGEWFAKYDPLKNDSIVGPVEEFRTDDGTLGHNGSNPNLLTIRTEAIGYNEAQPGGVFLKPGVGVLRKVNSTPYSFGSVYPIVDTGKWSVRVTARSISFRQVLNGPEGYAYIYDKTLVLDKHNPVMTLEHSLKNTGRKTIDTKVYDHDFFMFDGKPIGPGMAVRFRFIPKPVDPLGPAVKIRGKDIVFAEALGAHDVVSGYLTGYSASSDDYDFTVEDTNTGVGIQQTSDTPLSRIYFWSNRRAICPEAYIYMNIPPGKTKHWKIHYQFFAPDK